MYGESSFVFNSKISLHDATPLGGILPSHSTFCVRVQTFHLIPQGITHDWHFQYLSMFSENKLEK